MKPLDRCLLYAFIDTAYLGGRAADEVARQLCGGGADLIQLRAKTFDVEEVKRLAEMLAPILDRANVGLVINDYPDVAAAVNAPLAHLGQEDFFDAGWTDVRQVVEQSRARNPGAQPFQLGISTHAPEQAARAISAGADYIAIGPVFQTGTKPSAKPVTLEYVRWAAQHVTIPWFAIGGINLDNVDAVLEAGARRICVVSAILQAPDVARACQEFKDRLISARRDDPVS